MSAGRYRARKIDKWWMGMEPRAAPQSVPLVEKSVIPISVDNITLENTLFRKILVTTEKMQIVAMTLLAGTPESGTIPYEAHLETDQFIYVVQGNIQVNTHAGGKNDFDRDPSSIVLEEGEACVIPNGTWHEVVAFSDTNLFTIYSPPQHEPDDDQP